jgi:hypothetical protein
MRALNSVVGSLALVGFMACGGGSTHPPIIDVPIPPDAPIDAFACEFMMGANIDTMTMPIDFSTPPPALILTASASQDTPPVLIFSVVITFMSHPGAGIIMEFVDKNGVYAGAHTTTVAGNFALPPVAGTYPMDSGPGSRLFIVNGITDNGDGTVSIKPTQEYILSNNPTAQFVLTTWSSAAAAGTTTTNITGEYDNAMFEGHNIDAQGMDAGANTCTMMVTKLGWLKMGVKWPTPLPKPGNPLPSAVKDDGISRDWSQYTHVPAIKANL